MHQHCKWPRELTYHRIPLFVQFYRKYLYHFIFFHSTMIDTPQNREGMPDADKSEWLPPQQMAELIRSWAAGENRPENGSFAKLNYKNGTIVPEFL